jgi:pyruvate/2-oxoglutarate dehydrogenase complex dihydrolipoamide acyltransferase (E2) component
MNDMTWNDYLLLLEEDDQQKLPMASVQSGPTAGTTPTTPPTSTGSNSNYGPVSNAGSWVGKQIGSGINAAGSAIGSAFGNGQNAEAAPAAPSTTPPQQPPQPQPQQPQPQQPQPQQPQPVLSPAQKNILRMQHPNTFSTEQEWAPKDNRILPPDVQQRLMGMVHPGSREMMFPQGMSSADWQRSMRQNR